MSSKSCSLKCPYEPSTINIQIFNRLHVASFRTQSRLKMANCRGSTSYRGGRSLHQCIQRNSLFSDSGAVEYFISMADQSSGRDSDHECKGMFKKVRPTRPQSFRPAQNDISRSESERARTPLTDFFKIPIVETERLSHAQEKALCLTTLIETAAEKTKKEISKKHRYHSPDRMNRDQWPHIVAPIRTNRSQKNNYKKVEFLILPYVFT